MEISFDNILVVIGILSVICGGAGVVSSTFLKDKIDEEKGKIILGAGTVITVVMSALFLWAMNGMLTGINLETTLTEDDVTTFMTIRQYGVFIIPLGVYLIFLGKRLSFRN